jgi:hypothetical protein
MKERDTHIQNVGGEIINRTISSDGTKIETQDKFFYYKCD